MSLRGAAEQARHLDHGWIGPEHFLLAILEDANVASEALNGLGVTYERLLERLRARGSDPELPRAGRGLELNPAAHGLVGWAHGFAAAQGAMTPRPEHWLIALLYADDRAAMSLQPFGVRAPALLEALSGRGVPVPEHAPAEYRPWRGVHHISVEEDEQRPIVRLLGRRHPPGSEWRWGFNWVGQPRRCRITAEEGVDLDAIAAEVRGEQG